MTPCEAVVYFDEDSDPIGAHMVILGNVRAVAHWDYAKGWKVTPSLYLNQDLATVWLAP